MTLLGSPIEFEGDKDIPDGTYFFFVRHNNLLIKINASDIQWVNAEGNYCYIHLKEKKFVAKISLKKLILKLPRHQFIQIHKSCFVQVACIEAVDVKENFVRIFETNLPLGRIYKEKLLLHLEII